MVDTNFIKDNYKIIIFILIIIIIVFIILYALCNETTCPETTCPETTCEDIDNILNDNKYNFSDKTEEFLKYIIDEMREKMLYKINEDLDNNLQQLDYINDIIKKKDDATQEEKIYMDNMKKMCGMETGRNLKNIIKSMFGFGMNQNSDNKNPSKSEEIINKLDVFNFIMSDIICEKNEPKFNINKLKKLVNIMKQYVEKYIKNYEKLSKVEKIKLHYYNYRHFIKEIQNNI
tara:strand:+ start:120 stop:815 length:696 start_codon:yes stop_codon:yes gene_type:complete